MQLRDDKINIIDLDSMESAFRHSVRDGVSATRFEPMKAPKVYNLKEMLKDMTPPKIEHTCNGERYLTNCKACKINSWRLQGLSQDQIDLLLSTEKSK